MPYSKKSELPKNVRGVLPSKAQDIWMSAFNSAYDKYGDKKSFRIAWAAVRNSYKKVEGKWVAKDSLSSSYDYVYYSLEQDAYNVSKAEDGFTYMDYVLTSNAVDGDGYKFDGLSFSSMIDQINNDGLVGRVDDDGRHKEFHKMQRKGLKANEIEELSSEFDSGIKAVSARMEGTKLIARIQVRNDLLEKVKNVKGASVEARIPKDAIRGNTYNQARLTGFVLTNSPANPDSWRVKSVV